MRNRPIFQKIAQHPNIKKLSLDQLHSLDADELKRLVSPTAAEKAELELYSSSIKDALLASFARETQQSKLSLLLDKIHLAGFPQAEAVFNRDGTITVWPEGRPIEKEEL